jgi:hypothetical protein
MADYIITLPDGSTHTIQSGTINNKYDVPLVGQDAINYGDDFATGFMRLLTNFANTSAPTFGTERVAGQMWYDTTPITGGLNIYDGTSWDSIPLSSNVVTITDAQTISGAKEFSTAPDFSVTGGSPFTVTSTTLVHNLNAELLNGVAATAFATAAQGVLADAAEPDLGNPPTNGYVLSSTTGGARSWVSPAVGTGNINPADSTGAGSPTTMSLVLTDDPTGDQQPYTDSSLTYNASTNVLTTSTFVGNLTGNADTATLATTATTATSATQVTVASVDGNGGDTTMYPVLVAANSATDQSPHLDGGALSYNATSNTLTATNLAGAGGNITGLNANNISSGTLAVGRGGTNVTTSTGSGTAFVLHTSPTFVTSIVVPTINNSTGVVLQYNGSNMLGSQDRTASTNTSGGFIFDADGNNLDIGFNQMRTETYTTSAGVTLFDRDSAGHSFRSTHTSGAKIYQTEATGGDLNLPDGSMWIVRNFTTSTGTVTIQGGTASTVRHYNGSGTIVSTSGSSAPFTLARGGVATIVKVADSEYEMWGIGLTGGA